MAFLASQAQDSDAGINIRQFFYQVILLNWRCGAWALDRLIQERSCGKLWVEKPRCNTDNFLDTSVQSPNEAGKNCTLGAQCQTCNNSFPKSEEAESNLSEWTIVVLGIWRKQSFYGVLEKVGFNSFVTKFMENEFWLPQKQIVIHKSFFVVAQTNHSPSQSILLRYRNEDLQNFHMAANLDHEVGYVKNQWSEIPLATQKNR